MPTVSSTEGSPTTTCWKRRSSAASFSMCCRNSSSVVAPTMRSSPRASIGLIMLPASMAESPVAPAPTRVCSSSMKVTTCPSASVISWRTALSRSSNSPRYLAPATIALRSSAMRRLPSRLAGTSPATRRWARHAAMGGLPGARPEAGRGLAGGDARGQALDDGGLADAGLADEDRVVLGAAGQHLNDAADLGVPADDRVDLPVARPLRQVDGVLLQGLEGALRVRGRHLAVAAHGAEGGQQRLARGAGAGEHRAGLALGAGQADQQGLGRDGLVAQGTGLLAGGGEPPQRRAGRRRG